MSPTNPLSAQDLNLSSDQQELKLEFERIEDENAALKQQLVIQTEVGETKLHHLFDYVNELGQC